MKVQLQGLRNWKKWRIWKNWEIWRNIIIPFIVAVIILIIQRRTMLLGWIYLVYDNLCSFWSSCSDNCYVKITIAILEFLCYFFITRYLLKRITKWFIKHIFIDYHFKHSYGIVNKMIPRMIDLAQKNTAVDNNKMDRYIQSPMEYVNETVFGNQAPSFRPDASYQDVIYNKDIKFIVAITAENPNLWMDPTLCFYMANCCAVSLMRHVNKNARETKMLVEKGFSKMRVEYNDIKKTVLEKLSGKIYLESFEFIRFFLYDNDQKECCESAVFPSLKASQDLFRTLSFYIQKENMKEIDESSWISFENNVIDLWDLFPDAKKSTVLKNRKDNTIPEFLFLFFENRIDIYTYYEGHHHMIEADKTSIDGKIIYDKVLDLISYMAKYEVENGDDLDNPNLAEELRNKNNAFIDLE